MQWRRRAAVQRGRTQHVEKQLGDLLIAGGGGDAGGAGGRARRRVVLQRDGPIGQQPGHPQVDERPHPAGPNALGKQVPVVAQPGAHPVQQRFTARVARDADPLEGQRLAHHPPAVAGLAEDVAGVGRHVVQEHLVEVMRSEHRRDRPDGETGPVHRKQKEREPLGLWRVGIGAGRQHAPGRHLGVRRPHLLAGNAPPVPAGHGAGAQRDEVGSGLRLGKALAPDHVSGRDGRQVLGLLFGRAVTHQRRADPVDSHVLRTARLVLGPHFLAQHRLLPDRTTAAAMLFRPRQRQQPLGGQQLAERLGGGQVLRILRAGAEEVGGDVMGYHLPQVISQSSGVLAEVVIHRRHPFGSPSSRSAMMLRWTSDVPP